MEQSGIRTLVDQNQAAAKVAAADAAPIYNGFVYGGKGHIVPEHFAFPRVTARTGFQLYCLGLSLYFSVVCAHQLLVALTVVYGSL